MKIAYVAHYDIKDMTSGNGTDYFKAKALQDAGCEIDFIYPLEMNLNLPTRFERKLSYFFRQEYPTNLITSILKDYARQLTNNPILKNSDIVMCPTFHTISHLKINKPVVFWTDATLANLVSLYPGYQNLSPCILQRGHRAQALALKSSSLAIYSSDWAAKSAVFDYNALTSKIKVVPFGINFFSDQSRENLKDTILQRNLNSTCELFFIGFDFVRKGLDLALNIVKNLNEQNISARLTIVGSNPDFSNEFRKYVRVIGKLNKLDGGEEILRDIFRQSHFLLLPTLADCTPMVIAEAFSFGCPAISTDVGGIPSMIEKNINGNYFPLTSSAEDYSVYIRQVWQDKNRYNQMCLNAFSKYESVFDWKISGSKVASMLQKLCG